MFARLSTGFCVLLSLTALLDVNAGIVPVAREGNYGASELYAIIRDIDLSKRADVVGNNPEPDPGKPIVDLDKRAGVVVGNNPEPDPGKPTVGLDKRAGVVVGNNPEPDPGKPTVGFDKRAGVVVGNNPEPDPGKPTVGLDKRASVI